MSALTSAEADVDPLTGMVRQGGVPVTIRRGAVASGVLAPDPPAQPKSGPEEDTS